ncbi:5-hydroxytryptamine receptor 1D isoform X2 [Hermetia illucens]|nr:5-hydroxytryptamine receptor 1D isoform X2 [Hermetia illucens]
MLLRWEQTFLLYNFSFTKHRHHNRTNPMEFYESFNASSNAVDSLLLIPNSTQDAFRRINDTLVDTSDVQRLYPISLTWSTMCLVIVFCVLIVITIIGNTLVIIAVITTRRLRTVTNCFVMSLAVADLLVGIFVMPPAVALDLIGSWQLGWVLCDIWISLDVLLCTASILSLCAISVDRYLAVTRPLTYSRKRRSKRLALIMILIVWFLALAITCPPILGWYEPGRREDIMECRYNRNEGYVIFSAMGSFFIPMAVMVYVYARISCVVASRHDNMTDIEVHNKKFKRYQQAEMEAELEQDVSEQDNISPNPKKQAVRTLSNQTIVKEPKEMQFSDGEVISRQCKNGNYELVTSSSRPQSFKRPPSSSSSRPISTNSDHWSVGSRHSVRHHPIIINESYVTKSTRVHQKSLSNRVTSLKRENKTTQTLSIVVGGFIACWLPFFVNYLITPFLPDGYVSPDLAKFFTWLGWFNSAINPFIYAYYSVDFRAAFWRLTFKRLFKNSSKGQYPNTTLSIRR